MKKLIIGVFLLVICNTSFGWSFASKTKITAIAIWENSEVNPLYFKRSDKVWCYVSAKDKNLHSLILTLYATGKTADIHCHNKAERRMGGISVAHKLHRIITN